LGGRITLAIARPQTVFGPEMRCLMAAQVYGIVRLSICHQWRYRYQRHSI